MTVVAFDYVGNLISNSNGTNTFFGEKHFPKATKIVKSALKVIKNSLFYRAGVAIGNNPTISMIGIIIGKGLLRN